MNHKERRKLERQNKFKNTNTKPAPKQAEAQQAKQKPVQQNAAKNDEQGNE
jgi:hypothetical protein